MSDITADAIALESAMERLRQERETFNQALIHQKRWFILRLSMGYAAVVLLPIIAILCGYIAFAPENYSTTTVNIATGALFTDVLGLFASIWKVVLSPASIGELSPVTDAPALPQRKARTLPSSGATPST